MIKEKFTWIWWLATTLLGIIYVRNVYIDGIIAYRSGTDKFPVASHRIATLCYKSYTTSRYICCWTFCRAVEHWTTNHLWDLLSGDRAEEEGIALSAVPIPNTLCIYSVLSRFQQSTTVVDRKLATDIWNLRYPTVNGSGTESHSTHKYIKEICCAVCIHRIISSNCCNQCRCMK